VRVNRLEGEELAYDAIEPAYQVDIYQSEGVNLSMLMFSHK